MEVSLGNEPMEVVMTQRSHREMMKMMIGHENTTTPHYFASSMIDLAPYEMSRVVLGKGIESVKYSRDRRTSAWHSGLIVNQTYAV